jgi:3'(2'), 5'-bisphosphate nucleotidase
VTLADDHQLAWRLARDAGERLLARRDSGDLAPDSLRKAGDRLSHEYLVGELERLRPDDAVLSEEGVDDPARLDARRVWIIDPLDGTREFGERGRTDWAVHVALWQDGELAAGAVALPAEGRVLSTWCPEPTPHVIDPDHLRLVVSRTRPPAFLSRLVTDLGAVELPMGSAGAKAAAVISGRADAYVHSGGQFEWDSAAPVIVATAAGLHASRIDGSPLRYNQADPWLSDIVICPVELAPRLLGAIDDAMASGQPPLPAGGAAAHRDAPPHGDIPPHSDLEPS